MFGIFKKIEKLQKDFDQYKYDQENKPLYEIGQKLSDGTVISSIQKTDLLSYYPDTDINRYVWTYGCLKDGKIIKKFYPENKPIYLNELQKSIEKQNDSIKLQDSIIQKLQWQINNPPKYKVGEKVKEYGKCTYSKICDRMVKDGMPDIFGYTERFYYKYTFAKNNETITIC